MLRRSGVLAFTTLAAFALASCGEDADPIRTAGSSTVYPFTKAVADAFVQAKGGRKAPVVESTGTQAGIMRFCESAGPDSFDIADASRRMKRVEFERCQKNGVGDVIEVAIGLDGLALAESNQGPKPGTSPRFLTTIVRSWCHPRAQLVAADLSKRIILTGRVAGPNAPAARTPIGPRTPSKSLSTGMPVKRTPA